jgi:hypothetical protein
MKKLGDKLLTCYSISHNTRDCIEVNTDYIEIGGHKVVFISVTIQYLCHRGYLNKRNVDYIVDISYKKILFRNCTRFNRDFFS